MRRMEEEKEFKGRREEEKELKGREMKEKKKGGGSKCRNRILSSQAANVTFKKAETYYFYIAYYIILWAILWAHTLSHVRPTTVNR